MTDFDGLSSGEGLVAAIVEGMCDPARAAVRWSACCPSLFLFDPSRPFPTSLSANEDCLADCTTKHTSIPQWNARASREVSPVSVK